MKASYRRAALVFAVLVLTSGILRASTITHPYQGITRITDSETLPASNPDTGYSLPSHVANMNIVEINLNASGLHFMLSPANPPSPNTFGNETRVQTTLDFMNQEQAQVAINVHFFDFPGQSNGGTNLTGFAASLGNVYSAFESNPTLSYATIPNAPGLNISSSNNAQIVNMGANSTSLAAGVVPYNTVTGSAQIITNGVETLPNAPTKPGTSPPLHWYRDQIAARTAIGLSQDNQTLFLFTADAAGGSSGMTVDEEANFLQSQYGVYNALNLDGGGSTTLTMQDPATHVGSVINASSGGPRAVGSSLAIFAAALPKTLIWNQVGGTWNTISSNQPWLNGANPSAFSTGDTANFTDAAVGAVSIDSGGVSPATTNVSNSSGTYTFSGGQILGGAFVKTNAGKVILSNPGTSNGNTFSSMTISGGTVAIAPGTVANQLGTATGTNSLTITGTGAIDLGNSKLTINYSAGGGGSPDAATGALVLQGRASGNWSGTGITSSSAAGDPSHLEVLWADGSNNAISVAGATAGNELIEVTQMGDANGDGSVDGSDFVVLASHFGLATMLGPAAGDFTYDGTVDGSDFVALASNFGLGTPFTVAQINAFNSLATQVGESKAWIAGEDSKFDVVPEPSCLAVVTAGILLMARGNHRACRI